MRRKEVDHYDEIGNLFEQSITSALPLNWSCAVVNNTKFPNLRVQVDDLCRQLSLKKIGHQFPIVLPDVVIGVRDPEAKLRLVMVEVKGPASSVGLTDYSQMFGYLHSAQLLGIGILLLIEDKNIPSPTSSDLQRVIDGAWLPANWKFESTVSGEKRKYRTGIVSYSPGGNIKWTDLSLVQGISNWQEFIAEILNSAPISLASE